MPHARLTFVDVAGREPANSILSSALDMEDIAWLYESGHAIQTCLSRHLWLQQAGAKLPLQVPYQTSKVCLTWPATKHWPQVRDAIFCSTDGPALEAVGKLSLCQHEHATHVCGALCVTVLSGCR